MSPIITLEEHFISRSALKAAGANGDYEKFPPHIVAKLADLDLGKGDVSLQIVSHGPLEASRKICRAANDELAAAIAKNPTRLAGFALLPVGEPHLAADELDRCVKNHGFVGTLVDNHHEGKFYDDERF